MIRTEITVKRIDLETGEEKYRVITWDDVLNGFCGTIELSLKEGSMATNKVLHQSLTWYESPKSS